jgi:mevalonate kinase
MEIGKKYNSKVLLFGEYTVLNGTKALAIPFSTFYGNWIHEKNHPSALEIQKLKQYLLKLYYDGNFDNFDFDDLEYHIANGLAFDSSIPQGYGLGSSASVTAAIFDGFRKEKELLSLNELRKVLGQIESCYHGSSSGLDPLVCFLNQPVLIHDADKVELIDEQNPDIDVSLFLIDTQMPRRTAPLVEAYLKTFAKSEAFRKRIDEISAINEQLIDEYLTNDTPSFINSFQKLSWAQYNYLAMLIPNKYQEIWKKGHSSCSFDMKICGAGGGGFLMLMMYDEKVAMEILKNEILIPLKHVD